MMDFIIATNAPGKVRDWLIARGIGQMVDDGNGGQVFTGVHRGLKMTANGVPNPIPPGRPGAGLRMFLFRFAHDMATQDEDPEDGDGFRSKFQKWVKNNGTKLQQGLSDHWSYDPETDQWIEGDPATETVVDVWRVEYMPGEFMYLIRDISKIARWQ